MLTREEEEDEELQRMCEEMAESDDEPVNGDSETFGGDYNKVFTVSEAIRRDSGEGVVRGMIVSISLPFKVITKTIKICNKCNDISDEKISFPPLMSLENDRSVKCSNCTESVYTKPVEYTDAKIIQLQDPDTNIELELLDVFVYGKNTLHIGAGEIVRIKGKFNIQPNSGVRNKRLFTVLHANFTGEDPDSVIYEQRQTFTITNRDIESFHKFVELPNVIDRLASMVAPNVIGHKDKKVGILRSVVGGVEQSRRGRINTLFVGEIGTAKSTLARQATKILPKSRYVTAYNASAKSLLAIIEKDAETTTLRLGASVKERNL